jgi:hypothetical protein
MAIQQSDVEHYAAKGWRQLSDDVKQEQLSHAENLIDNQFGDSVATLPTLVGNADDAAKLLTAHLWELAEGGEAQSENSEGGSVTYNTTSGNVLNSLTETRYGRQFSDLYLRDRLGIGVVRPR